MTDRTSLGARRRAWGSIDCETSGADGGLFTFVTLTDELCNDYTSQSCAVLVATARWELLLYTHRSEFPLSVSSAGGLHHARKKRYPRWVCATYRYMLRTRQRAQQEIAATTDPRWCPPTQRSTGARPAAGPAAASPPPLPTGFAVCFVP